ncbi:hypothetical protein EW145_g5350 [Phellinidium pouzarii]|uniref:Uncharacterized protein n=1 Tax=Phellinidium pouzarii TaxID=167371 RepID=A0A4S4L0F6_9AGAM|nr:hypothetical protein EW145_g5350 [Phellinidium pouzarii]
MSSNDIDECMTDQFNNEHSSDGASHILPQYQDSIPNFSGDIDTTRSSAFSDNYSSPSADSNQPNYVNTPAEVASGFSGRPPFSSIIDPVILNQLPTQATSRVPSSNALTLHIQIPNVLDNSIDMDTDDCVSQSRSSNSSTSEMSDPDPLLSPDSPLFSDSESSMSERPENYQRQTPLSDIAYPAGGRIDSWLSSIALSPLTPVQMERTQSVSSCQEDSIMSSAVYLPTTPSGVTTKTDTPMTLPKTPARDSNGHKKRSSSSAARGPDAGPKRPRKTFSRVYLCTFEACFKISKDKRDQRRHEKTHRPNEYFCPSPWCNTNLWKEEHGFNRDSSLRRHLRNDLAKAQAERESGRNPEEFGFGNCAQAAIEKGWTGTNSTEELLKCKPSF